MLRLPKKARLLLLGISVILSVVEYAFVIFSSESASLQISKATQIFALTTISYLYISLLIVPFFQAFRNFPLKNKIGKLRNDFIVVTFYFATLHACFAFFGELGGFEGLGFLSEKFLIAITFSFTALIILLMLSVTSFNFLISKFKFFKWRYLSNFLYIAGLLILIHAMMLGTHFSNLSGDIPTILYFAISFLLLLEAPRIDEFLGKFIKIPKFGLSFLLLVVTLSMVFFSIINPIFSTKDGSLSFDIHAAHKQLAKQVNLDTAGNSQLGKIPGLNGDRNRRFTVSLDTDPHVIMPNQDTRIHFKVYEASSGNSITSYQILYTKLMHLVIVNSGLTYFSHIHPSFENSEFVITTNFPKDDIYHLYASFQPLGGIEQQVGFNLTVGNPDTSSKDLKNVSYETVRTVGQYTVSLDTKNKFNAEDMSQGLQKVSFSINDSKTRKPITNLRPYLGSFGHLTMINEKTFDYIHVHPNNLSIPSADEVSGPTVEFLPIGIYGPFKPGIYKAFAEFNPDDHLFVVDFNIKIN